MKYIELDGKDIQQDIKLIQEKSKEDSSIVFVYSGEGTLYDYIRFLNDGNRGLKNDDLYIFKLCYEKKDLDITYKAIKDGETTRSRKINSMSSLINELDGQMKCRIVVNTDERSDLAFIVQQLIFLQYPLENIDILLKKEVHDASKVNRFMQRVNQLFETFENAVERLTALRELAEQQDLDADLKADKLGDIDSALDSCHKIRADLEKAVAVELKLAVAASKKTGKSVIVNCFLSEEIAPTDAELATPNNCIYKHSPDEHYHLRMDDSDETKDYPTCADIHNAIDKKFRDAQNNRANGFALPDMHIGYATKANNFSSYTIYDTAGPDAAGTNHKDAAERAIRECDVAIFAIDYSKYLTASEEEYLKEVKQFFEGQQKFHSLIFSLNKTDVRYNDPKTLKSIISSVDFIRTRLASISSQYGDCIIFPTCSLEYFNVLEAQAANVTELNSPISDMKALKFAHRDVPALQWLHTHSENLEYYHGIQSFSADVFMKDSGMPALMNYVLYIATSKARDEIVNNIAFQIDQQNKKLQTVLNTVSNLEALIQADEQQIQAIKDIIERYNLAIQVILQESVTEDDLNALSSPNRLKDRFHGDFSEFIEYLKKSIKASCNSYRIANIVSEEIRQKIWERLSSNTEPMKQEEGERVLEGVCKASDLTDVVRNILKEHADELQKKFNGEFQEIREEMRLIGIRRQKMLENESIYTMERLEKQNVSLALPEISDFNFDVPLKPINLNALNISSLNISRHLKFDDFFKTGKCKSFIKRIFPLACKKMRHDLINEKEFRDIYNTSIQDTIENTVCVRNNVPGVMEKILSKTFIEEYAKNTITRFKAAFEYTMNVQKDAITQFCKAIDDRDRYRADIERKMERKQNIAEIQGVINGFMTEWDTVIGDVKEAAKDGID